MRIAASFQGPWKRARLGLQADVDLGSRPRLRPGKAIPVGYRRRRSTPPERACQPAFWFLAARRADPPSARNKHPKSHCDGGPSGKSFQAGMPVRSRLYREGRATLPARRLILRRGQQAKLPRKGIRKLPRYAPREFVRIRLDPVMVLAREARPRTYPEVRERMLGGGWSFLRLLV